MTTNSHNPVDGDVQALIADCQAEIAEIEKALTTWGDAWIPSLQSKLKRQQVALAALTAEPVAYVHPAYLQPGALGFDASVGRLAPAQVELYTTPPAQLLRPVELPEFKVHSNQPCWPSITVGLSDGEWIEALRQQGYEVKS